jgi:hypothetical protein
MTVAKGISVLFPYIRESAKTVARTRMNAKDCKLSMDRMSRS